MDALTLSRIQFAFTVGFHFIFVPLSIGLALMVVLAERRYYKSGIPAHRAASDFWIKLFTTTFAVGVATGITMEFAFGANWAEYSRFVGNIFGAPLAAEGLFAFFLESTFLGILLFGRKRVSRGFYYASCWLVMAGAWLSALWILIANSWQQTPRGYKVEDGKAVLTDFWAAAFNPSTAPRYAHTMAGALIAGCFVVASIAAWYLLKRRHLHFARQAMKSTLIAGLVVSAAMPFIGHWHALEVAEEQPVKMAAFESVYETGPNATLWLAGWVRDGGKSVTGVGIPSGLSLMLGLDPDHVVTGLASVPATDRPPVQLTFQSYHIMIALSFLFIAIMLVALVLLLLKRLENARWMLWVLVVSFPLPLLAMNMGWMAAEVGRQPWVVQGLLRTEDGVSPVVSAGEVWTTLVLFAAVYAVLFVAWLRVFLGIIRKGPDELTAASEPAAAETAPVGGTER
ncbi:MAG TPA: cytochrome ubiquinol oxidase subunit I [Thermoleophilia bacterium]|nr:cytochrome ubiquinol oxidase subunit I [Thermoleophilia bacterium]HQJ98392.1 cytochrome ubiquinol oxidase subunit I [Thermoleophilia bacterium]